LYVYIYIYIYIFGGADTLRGLTLLTLPLPLTLPNLLQAMGVATFTRELVRMLELVGARAAAGAVQREFGGPYQVYICIYISIDR